jgi:alkylated DNA repair dioxygenase AlkB
MQIRPKLPPRHTLGVVLEPGSVLLMTGNAQDRFEHCIPKLGAHVEERISVVFRTKVDERAE